MTATTTEAAAPRRARQLLGRLAVDYLPRLLGLGDRHPASPTFGCFDRNYWHYRILDLANARYQEAALALVLAHRLPIEPNPFRDRPALLEWARAATAFWAKSQHRDGSMHEVYPNERSFCATSFSTWAVAETATRLAGQYDLPALKEPLARAANWLHNNHCPLVANQRAAAALALITVGQLLQEDRLIRWGCRLRDQLLSDLTEEGFFPEYGGGDVGYQSLTLSCLTQMNAKVPQDNQTSRANITRALTWLDARIGPNGHCDTTNTSRCTQWLYPLALVANNSPAADRLLDGLETGRAICPAWLDDRYSLGLAIDYLLTASLPEQPIC